MGAKILNTLFSRKGRLAMAFVLAATAAVVAWVLLADQQWESPGMAASAGGYAGSEACKACHEEVYNGWRTTFHAYKFRPADADSVIGDFKVRNTISAGKVTTTMTARDGAYFVTIQDAAGEPLTHRVKYVLGSIWKQRYITQLPNGALHVLPLQWNVASLKWSPYYGLADHPAGKAPGWDSPENTFQYQCLGCHATNAEVGHDEATGAFNTTWTEMGVGCEACHGPGENHIQADIPDKAATILNPAKLPDPRRAAMVCGACHTRGGSTDGRYAYPVGYKPGAQLNFMFDENPGVYPDGSPKSHHQQYNDWKASGHAAAGVNCWDCHSPHIRGKSNRFQLKLPGSLLCRTCHSIEPVGVHGLHSAGNCIGCHMPNTIKSATQGDLRSHRFLVARPEHTVKSGGVKAQPNSCNLCHYHKDADPERLVHYLNAVKKPAQCKACHYHAEQDPDEENQ